MHPANSNSRGGSRPSSAKYAHSPYMYRTTVEDAPVSPMSDQGIRGEASSVPLYHSPRSLHNSTANVDAIRQSGPGSQTDGRSQPSSPLISSPSAVEFSQPIQVGSAPNVHARYRRGMQSPLTRSNADISGSRSAFPSSPTGSLPPRSSLTNRDEGNSNNNSGFFGGESAPQWVAHPNTYKTNAGPAGSAPQYTSPLPGSYRSGAGGGLGSGQASPRPYYGAAPSSNPGNSSLGSHFSPPPPAPPPSASSAQSVNNNSNANTSYAPSGFSMPPTMATVAGGGNNGGHSGSYHGSPSGHLSPPLAGSGSRPPQVGSAPYSRDQPPLSPTHRFHNAAAGPGNVEGHSANLHGRRSSYSGSAPPPTFATAVQQQQQQQQHSPSFAVGSFPGRRPGPHGGHLSSPFAHHVSPNTNSVDISAFSESYGTNTKSLSTMADDTVSSSGKSGSSASSIRDDLPLCPNDDNCTLINDRKHQKKYAHTCRLFPCYHGHVTRHAKLFRHAEGQISLPEGMAANTKVSSQALASVNFSTISPEAPNAYRIYVSHGDKSYEIFGDWATVKVHTFKRYLHQVYHIPPSLQVLSVVRTGKVMDDDINTVKCYGIDEDAVIQLRNDIDDTAGAGKLRIPLDDL